MVHQPMGSTLQASCELDSGHGSMEAVEEITVGVEKGSSASRISSQQQQIDYDAVA